MAPTIRTGIPPGKPKVLGSSPRCNLRVSVVWRGLLRSDFTVGIDSAARNPYIIAG
jgi:hypothetical protein